SATLMRDGEYELGSLVVKLEKGKCTIEGTDTIAGSVLTMDTAFRNFLSQGYSIEQASKFLSTNPARVMSLDKEGSIDIGMRGNVAVLNERNLVTGIIKDGIYYDFQDQVR
ncbi:N-acetylglucosamine-6-phosphate deacetylase, partial [mine drainage metagenome]